MTRVSDAEALLYLADIILYQKDKLLTCEGITDTELAVSVLAVKLRRQNPALVLRAIVEGWPRERIIREMY